MYDFKTKCDKAISYLPLEIQEEFRRELATLYLISYEEELIPTHSIYYFHSGVRNEVFERNYQHQCATSAQVGNVFYFALKINVTLAEHVKILINRYIDQFYNPLLKQPDILQWLKNAGFLDNSVICPSIYSFSLQYGNMGEEILNKTKKYDLSNWNDIFSDCDQLDALQKKININQKQTTNYKLFMALSTQFYDIYLQFCEMRSKLKNDYPDKYPDYKSNWLYVTRQHSVTGDCQYLQVFVADFLEKFNELQQEYKQQTQAARQEIEPFKALLNQYYFLHLECSDAINPLPSSRRENYQKILKAFPAKSLIAESPTIKECQSALYYFQHTFNNIISLKSKIEELQTLLNTVSQLKSDPAVRAELQAEEDARQERQRQLQIEQLEQKRRKVEQERQQQEQLRQQQLINQRRYEEAREREKAYSSFLAAKQKEKEQKQAEANANLAKIAKAELNNKFLLLLKNAATNYKKINRKPNEPDRFFSLSNFFTSDDTEDLQHAEELLSSEIFKLKFLLDLFNQNPFDDNSLNTLIIKEYNKIFPKNLKDFNALITTVSGRTQLAKAILDSIYQQFMQINSMYCQYDSPVISGKSFFAVNFKFPLFESLQLKLERAYRNW